MVLVEETLYVRVKERKGSCASWHRHHGIISYREGFGCIFSSSLVDLFFTLFFFLFFWEGAGKSPAMDG